MARPVGAATVLLASQRVVPLELQERQFAFDFPTVAAALEDIVTGAGITISPALSRPDGAGAARYHRTYWFQIATLPEGNYPYSPSHSGRIYVKVGGHPKHGGHDKHHHRHRRHHH